MHLSCTLLWCRLVPTYISIALGNSWKVSTGCEAPDYLYLEVVYTTAIYMIKSAKCDLSVMQFTRGLVVTIRSARSRPETHPRRNHPFLLFQLLMLLRLRLVKNFITALPEMNCLSLRVAFMRFKAVILWWTVIQQTRVEPMSSL
jgi:hypothetical protein